MLLINCFILMLVPYYYDKRIHNMGNTGFLGNIHAVVSPLITKIIDNNAYNSVNIRNQVYNDLEGDVIDLCCGTGFSTKPGSLGIDTSIEMLRFARFYNPGSNYLYGNSETFGKDKQYDIATCMFAFHEMPNKGHEKIIENAIRIAKKKVLIVDISTKYKPSKMMLLGEPYILNYLDTIDKLLVDFNKTTLIKNHVDIWELNL